MLRFLPAPVKLVWNFVWGALATTLIGLTIIVLGVFKFLLPVPVIQRTISSIANSVFRLWAYAVSAMFRMTHKTEWTIHGDLPDDRNGWYLMMSNHVSWVDIVVVMHLSRKQLPMPRFFLKQELFWVPIIGLGCWVLDMPFMKRYSREQIAKNPELKGKDIATTREKCEKFRYIPTTVINFCEGTRFTPKKHKQKNSPFTYLLPPKAGGTSFTLQAMGSQFKTILDITLIYPEQTSGRPLVIDFLSGRLNDITVYVDTIPVTPDLQGDYFNDEEFKAHFQSWLNERWKLKDKRIAKHMNPGQKNKEES